MSETIVKVENLSHSYTYKKQTLLVLNDISFNVNKGEIISILGPSGSGKSTLLKCIAGLLDYTAGTVTIKSTSPKKSQSQKQIGFAFQEAGLLEWLNVTDNILLPTQIGNKTINMLENLNDLLRIIGLEKFSHYYPHQLSGGMKQRVALARALITQPEIILLDEPFGAIDLLTRTKLMLEFTNIIKQLNTTALIVTHSIEEAVFMSDKILILSSLPAAIQKEILLNFNEIKSLNLLANIDFIQTVNECRKFLMNE